MQGLSAPALDRIRVALNEIVLCQILVFLSYPGFWRLPRQRRKGARNSPANMRPFMVSPPDPQNELSAVRSTVPRDDSGFGARSSRWARLRFGFTASRNKTRLVNVIPSVSPLLSFFLRPEGYWCGLSGKGNYRVRLHHQKPCNRRVPHTVGGCKSGKACHAFHRAVIHRVPNHPLFVLLPDFVSRVDSRLSSPFINAHSLLPCATAIQRRLRERAE